MAMVQVSQEDVDNLAHKLDEFTAVLTDRERLILHGVLSMAGKSIDQLAAGAPVPGAVSPPENLPSLATGFKEAFQHGVGTRFTVQPLTEAEGLNIKGGVNVDYTK